MQCCTQAPQLASQLLSNPILIAAITAATTILISKVSTRKGKK